MNRVVHVAISGSSGSGKTNFPRYLIHSVKSLTNKKLFQKYALYAGIAIAILGYLLLKKLGIIDK